MQLALSPTPKNGSVKKTVNEEVAKVLKTYDYSMFKIMADNREINLLHVRRLVESFEKDQLICPIIVNENYEVIDGQHRLRASEETGRPVYYLVIKGYGIKEVQVLNTNQKNWTKTDYLEMYCSEGLKPYLQFKQFMVDFPDFGIQSAERILTFFSGGNGKSKKIKGVASWSVPLRAFENGNLELPDIRKSYSLARKIMEIKPFYKNFHRGTFVSAIMPHILNNKEYVHSEMIHKLQHSNIKLIDCNTVETYRQLLEKIYNYRRQDKKISLTLI